MVAGVATSGVVAAAMSEAELKRIDAALSILARKVMQGYACYTSGDRPRSLPNTEMWTRLRTSPCHIEMRIQRIRWWQYIVAAPSDNVRVLAVLCGTLEQEEKPPLLPSGAVSPEAHPWAQQLAQDFNALGVVLDQPLLMDIKPLVCFPTRRSRQQWRRRTQEYFVLLPSSGSTASWGARKSSTHTRAANARVCLP